MKTTTYICDKCKKSVGATDLYSVEVSLKKPDSNGYSSTLHSTSKDICKDCLKSIGILTEIPEDKKQSEAQQTKNQKTFEDRFCDMLSDLGVLFEE